MFSTNTNTYVHLEGFIIKIHNAHTHCKVLEVPSLNYSYKVYTDQITDRITVSDIVMAIVMSLCLKAVRSMNA